MLRFALANPNIEFEREAYAFYGQPIPEHMWPPEFIPGAQVWYEAFWELSTERQIGMGVGPIPASKVREYCRGWPDADAFASVIRAMDGVYLDHQSKKSDSQTTLSPGKRN